jgi:GNAT superfamily N-acetyltransferase
VSETVRLLMKDDIPRVMELNRAAGWNQTEADWQRVLDLEPEGCFVLETEERIAATTTAVRYGTELAWIGMVLTLPEFRGRGYARRLMTAAIDYLESHRVDWIKLDATDMGRPLYTQLGFQDECPVERWWLDSAPLIAPPPVSPYTAQPDLDRQAFGADRTRLLTHLSPGTAASIADGFAMGRPGANATYFGPCVTSSQRTAEDLLCWFLSHHAGHPIFWDLFPRNEGALILARHYGFERKRKLVRMAKPGRPGLNPILDNRRLIYALAGFEFG